MTAATGSLHNHFNCRRGCDPAAPLTLIDREVITGRQIAERDGDGSWYCADCLAALPADPNGELEFAAMRHVCGEEDAAPPVAHQTRTYSPRGFTGHYDKRSRPMVDRSAFARCTCGWVTCWDTREIARGAARAHRDEAALAS